MSTGIALLLALISYTQVHTTGNYFIVEKGLSNLQTPPRRRNAQLDTPMFITLTSYLLAVFIASDAGY